MVIYYIILRKGWLIKLAKMFRKVLEFERIRNFMIENGSPVPQLKDGQWLLDLCCLVNITTKLNELNKKLQEQASYRLL